MAFDNVRPTDGDASAKTTAVIGSGISGLSAAWLLSKSRKVTLYEAGDRIGGHSNTVIAPLSDGDVPVDTGFIVFNQPSYPNFTAMLSHLGVDSEASCMSFGVSLNAGRLEYSGQSIPSVFARKRNSLSPRFWRMLVEIPRFHREAREALREGYPSEKSLGNFVAERKFSEGFVDYFLKPMAAAIWSTPQFRILEYPARSFFQFFENHGLLQVLNLPEWHTVSGGSRSYVKKLVDGITGDILTKRAVVRVERTSNGVVVCDVTGEKRTFDDVVIAAHGDQALSMLDDSSDVERSILGAFQYQRNKAVLHLDERQMPGRRRAWSSWNFIGDEKDGSVTYWMNRLQNLRCRDEVFVTLNPSSDIDASKIIASFDYDHPMFNAKTQKAQSDIWSIQGNGGVWFAGAHLGHGFHEDGLQSGLAVAELIGGISRPWEAPNASGRLRHPPALLAKAS